MTRSHSDRVRITISLSREVAERINELVDGVRIRNRSHAVESLVSESLHLARIHQAVILAGGKDALERVSAIKSILHELAKWRIHEAFLAVGYLGDQVKEKIGDERQYGIRLHYSYSDLGTGGALREIRNQLHQSFLVVNIKEPVSLDLNSLLKFHREHHPVATIATRSLRELSGIYVLEPAVFDFIPAGFCMLEETVFHEMTKQGKLLPYPILNDGTEKE